MAQSNGIAKRGYAHEAERSSHIADILSTSHGFDYYLATIKPVARYPFTHEPPLKFKSVKFKGVKKLGKVAKAKIAYAKNLKA